MNKKVNDMMNSKLPEFSTKKYTTDEKESYYVYCLAIDEISQYIKIKQRLELLIMDIEDHLENLDYTLKWAHKQIHITGYHKHAIIRAYTWDIEFKNEIIALKRRYSIFKQITNEKILIDNLKLIIYYEKEYSDFKDPTKEDYIEMYAHLVQQL